MPPTYSSPSVQMTPEILEKALNGPALPPPKGIIPHLVNHSEKENLLYIVGSLCMGIMGILITVRIYTKLRVIRKLEAADCMYQLQGHRWWISS
jgi:hypothetical protein